MTEESAGKLQAAMANQAEKENVLTAMADALSAGDVKATMALFTDGAIIKLLPTEMFPTGTFIGTGQIRFFIQHLITINFKSEFEILQVFGDIAITRSKTWKDTFIKLGIAPMDAIMVYSIQDGKIKGFISILTDESLAKLQAALAPK